MQIEAIEEIDFLEQIHSVRRHNLIEQQLLVAQRERLSFCAPFARHIRFFFLIFCEDGRVTGFQ